MQAFRNKLEFFAAAKVSPSFPPPELPEIAFAGTMINPIIAFYNCLSKVLHSFIFVLIVLSSV